MSEPAGNNFLGLEPAFSGPDARCVVLQAPFEATSTFGGGSDAGPAAIVAASHEVELFDAALGFEAFRACGGIHTPEALPVEGRDGESFNKSLDEAVSGWIAQGKFVATLGGEHSSIVGAAHAHLKQWPGATILQLDAHSDLRPSYQGTPWNHACAVARMLDFTPNIVQAGIRSQAAEERVIADGRGLPVFYAHDLHEADRASGDWAGNVLAACGDQVYITFDCDVFDPAVVPSTGTPEPGGMTWEQVNRLLSKLFATREVVGFDVSELAPIPHLHHPQFTIAKLIYRMLGYKFPA